MGLTAFALLVTLTFSSCKKDSSSSTPSSASQIATAQDAESQDALVQQVEQDADNMADALESSNFNTSEAKAGNLNGISISVTHPNDTVTFPKYITLIYNYVDTINGENMSQTGQISIMVDTIPVHKKLWWRKHVIRTFQFSNFTVTNDSSSLTVNGYRTMARKDWIQTLSDNNLKLRVAVQDSIYATFEIGVTNGSFSGSFTRKINRSRNLSVHYYKLLAINRVWRPLFNDTLTFAGSITGMNLQDSAYSRIITKPLVFTLCPVWPHNMSASGQITDTEGTQVTTINYTPDGCKNNVSGTDAHGNNVPLNRKINRSFHKWWK